MRIIGAARMEEEHRRGQDSPDDSKRVVLAGEDSDELFPGRVVKHTEQEGYGAFDPFSSDRAEAATMRRDPPLPMRHTFEREDAVSSPRNGRSPHADLFATPDSFSFRGASSMPVGTGTFGNISKVFNTPAAAGVRKKVPTGPRAASVKIKRVPSGPRAGVAHMRDTPTDPSGSRPARTNRSEPHLFISTRNLPVQSSMLEHVKRFFIHSGFQIVHMDAAGYYIIFADTADGRRRLAKCAKRAKDAVMFSQYILKPKVFYDNKEVNNLDRLSAASAAERSRSSSPGIPILGRAKQSNTTAQQTVSDEIYEPPKKSFVPRPLSSSPQLSNAALPAQSDRKSQLRSVIAQVGTSTSPPAERTTPSKSAIRQYNDDVSSVYSGTTASSRSKAAECRVCKGLGGATTLCRSCIRNYHAHCRPQGSLKGSTKDKLHTYWQCASCARKGKPRLYKALDDMASSPAVVREAVPDTMLKDLPAAQIGGGEPSQRTEKLGDFAHAAQPLPPLQPPDSGENNVADKLANTNVLEIIAHNESPQAEDQSANEVDPGLSMPAFSRDSTREERHQTGIQERARAADTYKKKLKRDVEQADFTSDNHDQKSDSCRVAKKARFDIPDAQRVDTRHRNAPDSGATVSDPAAPIQPKPTSLHEATCASLVALNHPRAQDDDVDVLDEAQNLVEQSFTSSDAAIREVKPPKKLTFTRVKRAEIIASTSAEREELAMVSPPAQLESPDHNALPEVDKMMPQPAAVAENMESRQTGEHGPISMTPDPSILGSRPNSPSPSNSLPRPQARRTHGVTRAKRTKVVSMKCNTCGKSVPYNPSGRSECTTCKEKSARGTPIPEQSADTKVPQTSTVETVRVVTSDVPVPDVASEDMLHSKPSHDAYARIDSEAAAAVSAGLAAKNSPGVVHVVDSTSTAAAATTDSATATQTAVENLAQTSESREGVQTSSEDQGGTLPETIDSTEAAEVTPTTSEVIDDTVDGKASAASNKNSAIHAGHSTSTTNSSKVCQPTQSGKWPCPLAKEADCDKWFSSSRDAVRHGKIHTGVKDFTCPACDKPFARKDKMMEHFKSVHKNRVPSKKRDRRHSTQSSTAAAEDLEGVAKERAPSEVDVEPALSLRETSENIDSYRGSEAIAANERAKTKGKQRKSQRSVAVDHNDLGNSFERPPNTYVRLIGMALCAAADNRATPQWVVQWIADHIPNYALEEGTWADSVKAVMKLNSSGSSGKVIATATALDPTDTRKSAKKVYELLPGLAERLDHWDEVLQQPVSPIVARQSHATASSGKALRDNITQKGPSTGKLTEPSHSKAVPQKRSSTGKFMGAPKAKIVKTSIGLSDDAMEMDYDDLTQSRRHEEEVEPDSGADTDNEDWTGDAMRRREVAMSSLRPEIQQDGGAETFDDLNPPFANPGRFGQEVSAEQSSTTPQADAVSAQRRSTVSPVKHSPAPASSKKPTISEYHKTFSPFEDQVLTAADLHKEDSPCFDEQEEAALLDMIRQDRRTRVSSSRSLFADRPQFNPNNRAKQQAKMIEISKRPKRKQLFGKPVSYSVPEWTEFFEGRSLTTSMNISPIKKSVRPPLLGEDSTSIQEFDSLKEFLGLPDDLVPAIIDKQLVYKHKDGNKRGVYRTGI